MAEHGQKGIARSVGVFRIRDHRLGQRLVDRFVEADHVARRLGRVRRHMRLPEAQHRCAQRAVFGRQLDQRETDGLAQCAVNGRRAASVDFLNRLPFGLFLLLATGLPGVDVGAEFEQNFARMVAQDEWRHTCRSRNQRLGEDVPLKQDFLEMRDDKSREFHAGLKLNVKKYQAGLLPYYPSSERKECNRWHRRHKRCRYRPQVCIRRLALAIDISMPMASPSVTMAVPP